MPLFDFVLQALSDTTHFITPPSTLTVPIPLVLLINNVFKCIYYSCVSHGGSDPKVNGDMNISCTKDSLLHLTIFHYHTRPCSSLGVQHPRYLLCQHSTLDLVFTNFNVVSHCFLRLIHHTLTEHPVR